MNIPLLRRIQSQIRAEPVNFCMDKWHCGTARCIAGWAQKLSFGVPELCENNGWLASKEAMRALEIDTEEAERLFYVEMWPNNFVHKFEASVDQGARAEVACDRIEHFIQTFKREGGAK